MESEPTRIVMGEGYLFGVGGIPTHLVGLSATPDDSEGSIALQVPPLHQMVMPGETVDNPERRRKYRLVLEVVEEPKP